MKWLLIAIALLLLAVLLIVAIGWLLPVAHTASRSIEVPAEPARVWAALTNVAAYPAWRSDVTTVESVSPQQWRERGRQGTMTYEIVTAEPPTKLVTRIADRTLPYGGEWQYDIAPVGPGASRVTITERGEVYNPIFRLLSRFVFGYTATLDAYLRALAAHLGGPTHGR